MKKALVFVLLLLMALLFSAFSQAEVKAGIVAKVTTANGGPLKLRTEAAQKSLVLAEIPNGTCIVPGTSRTAWFAGALWEKAANAADSKAG